jgi:chromosome segregation ATPase
MEFEQIVKRLEFLDKQQRDSKDLLASLNERLQSFETSVNATSKQIKALAKQVSDSAPNSKRIEQFEALLAKQRNEIVRLIEDNEKLRARNERDSSKKLQSELAEVNKAIGQLKIVFDAADVKKQNKQRADEIQRTNTNLSELKLQMDEVVRANQDTMRAVKLAEETRVNDLKRVTDIQGELTALRKRVDENREKVTITTDSLKNIENRFTQLLASEAERKQAQAAFLEQQAVAQIDRERAWKEWREKFDAFQNEASSLDEQVQKLDEALKGAKKAQDTYVELNTKLERRISEVTEMQRLTEDRLRQEWLAFKADDQKRWTGHSLSSEESFRDMRKDLQKAEEKVTALYETAQTLHDQLHQTTDATEKQLQELMNVVHEWMTSYQRIMGHGKKTVKK